MERHELDNVMHTLGQILEIYSKKLDSGAVEQWRLIFSGREHDDCIRALEEYVKTEKHAPKPCHIEELIKSLRVQRGDIKEAVYKGCDPLTIAALESDARPESKIPANCKVASAWMEYHCIIHGGLPPIIGVNERKREKLTKEQVFEIVNQQASSLGFLEAVAPEHKINSYWENRQTGGFEYE